ncbi:hypothetical protein K488DRAFT_84391 [Vararia minispora EC-137]|uniref:Uncharacterized protein n=1 Tax=Vararia minispora EC-137 TaxID=1314806 RepID=A0ACB8QRR5_9AGAM|nr:hypothetical protein K488DRAFT_84391 [Vararia minispora EC-137]
MSVAASVRQVAHEPPSQFAALLRRSKFASFDRSIPQVYASHGGDAYRGNYGVKRSLTPTKKGLPIIISNVDSPHQQTEWQPAAKEARWIERWETLPPPRPMRGGWEKTVGPNSLHQPIDSEFSPQLPPSPIPDPGDTPFVRIERALQNGERALAVIRKLEAAGAASHGADADIVKAREESVKGLLHAARQLKEDTAETSARQNSTPVENIHAMPPDVFERYLRKLARLRPLFHRFVQQRSRMHAIIRVAEERYGLESTPGQSRREFRNNLWDASTESDSVFVQRLFLASLARHKHSGATGSLEIMGQAHRVAGLSYQPLSPLTDLFLTKPQPGRYVDAQGRRMLTSALFAGMRVSLDAGAGRGSDAIRKGFEEGKFRVSHTILLRPPRAGLKSALMAVRAVDTETYQTWRPKLLRPGTRAFIGRNTRKESQMAQEAFAPLARVELAVEEEAGEAVEPHDNGVMLDLLQGLIPGGREDKRGE